jgi:hypothetical protein
MSLLLNGAKTMTIAGTEMQCLEIYTGEAYTFPITFTDSSGNASNALSPNAWGISTSAKFYTVDNVTYSENNDQVVLGNINLNVNQPLSNEYTLLADWSNAANGTAYLYVGNNITNTGNTNIPQVNLANNTANSTLVIVTVELTRESLSNASLTNINREPLGFIVRYQ